MPGPAAPVLQLPQAVRRAAPLMSMRLFAVLCVVVPLAVYALVGAWRWQQLMAETEVRLDRSLRIAQEHTQKVLEGSASLLDRLHETLGRDDLRAREPELHARLQALSLGKPEIGSIWIYDAAGQPLVSDRQLPAPRNFNVADRGYFAWHRSNPGGAGYISEPVVGRSSGGAFFVHSRGRLDADGGFGGAIAVALLPAYFEGFYGNLVDDEPGMAITMLRKDGTILARAPTLAGGPPTLARNSPVMTRIAAGASEGAMLGVSSVDGRKRLLAFRQVGTLPVYVGTGMDLAEVRGRWFAEMAWLAAFGLPPTLGVFLVGRLALRRAREALQAASRLNDETVARQRAEQTLLQAQKLEALGRLTGGVAHDFNNALMVISNSLYLLQRRHPGLELPEVGPIGRAVESATKLTRQLLAFSRRQALLPQHTSLQDRLPKMEGLLKPVLGSLSRLRIGVTADCAPIVVDAAEFELALLNLAINARDAMHNGGELAVSARNAAKDALPAPLKGKGPFVVVQLVDSGGGIAPEVLDKVFEPFFTTKPVGEGTGLGLSQVWGLCQRAGGHASIVSQPGQGTTVSLYFPAAAPAPATAPAAAAPTVQRLDLSLLLVEDNDEVAGGLQDVLAAMHCRVTHLSRADEAVTWLARQPAPPDVLLSDVVMPGHMDGLALAEHARRQHPGLHIVLMTGYAAQLAAISAAGFTVLPKPCAPEALAAALTANAATSR